MGLFEATGSWSVALGKTLLHSMWIGFLLLLALRVILRQVPSRIPLLRYRISTIILLLFAGITTCLFLALYAPGLKTDPSRIHDLAFPVITGLVQADKAASLDATSIRKFYLFCCYLYFAGVAFMLLRSVRSMVQVRRLKGTAFPLEGAWYELFLQLKERLRLGRNIELSGSHEVDSPAVVGWIKPVILVPAGMFTHLSVQQVETILLHELYHLKRLDFVISLIQLMLENLYFYHPAVWIMSGWIRTEREHCCDDLVMKSCGDPFLYARALLQLAGNRRNENNLLIAAAGRDQFQLLARIRRILNIHTMKTNLREKLYGTLLLVGGMLIFFVISGFTSGFSIVRSHNLALEAKQVPEPVYPDTVPVPGQNETEEADWEELKEELEAVHREAMEEIDWEALKEEMEAARRDAMEEIDWEALKEEMEAARREAMEEIDWEALKEEMEAARRDAMEEIDWEAIKQEIERSKIHLDSIRDHMDLDIDVDWDAIREGIEDSMKDIEIDLDLDQLREEIEHSMEEIDWEQIHEQIEHSMEEIDWEQLKEEMEKLHIHLDSLHYEMEM